jgi:hypothetical protein
MTLPDYVAIGVLIFLIVWAVGHVRFVAEADIGRLKVLHQANSGLSLEYWRMR